ncbi:MAG TPA: CPBP family intramembrane glutamic endopeptidase [Candidatus Cybelea sp.]|nr:CPBP family intramembrane glutamic endopeptidase [Candidatus Cybelea sp.]
MLAILVNLAFQLVRLRQTDPASWLALDYGMRISTLLILAVPPAMRRLVYAREWRETGMIETVFWILIVGLFIWVTDCFQPLWALVPDTSLGGYPASQGGLRLLDLTFGLALVAVHEELLFRRAMRIALSGLGDGRTMILVSAALFGAYHWWRGIPTVFYAALFGLVAMLLYRRTGVLWPLVLLHYLTDLAYFA